MPKVYLGFAELPKPDPIIERSWCYEIAFGGEPTITIKKRSYGPEIAAGLAQKLYDYLSENWKKKS